MNDMNFENIDTLIKEAAQNASQPNFDEAAWNKMDQLLDKEFGKKKRRFFIWWWLLPIAIGGFFCAYYFIVTQQIIPANQNQIIHSESSKTIANKSDKNSSDKKTKIDQNKISNDFERKVQAFVRVAAHDVWQCIPGFCKLDTPFTVKDLFYRRLTICDRKIDYLRSSILK